MSGNPFCSYALIDPVGSKAGMDQYDIALAKGLAANGVNGVIISNFTAGAEGPVCILAFDNLGKRGIRSAWNTLSGLFKGLHLSRLKKAEWIIFHVFTASIVDACFLTLARMLGFRCCGIVHDIETLDEFSPGIVRKWVIGHLLHKRIVHNRFSFDELVRTGIIDDSDPHTHIIPHVHFIPLFEGKSRVNAGNGSGTDKLVSIHPALKNAVMNGEPILLFFGQIKKPKGLNLLLTAFSEIENEAVLVIAGKTRDESWQRYHDQIRELGIQNRVIPVIRHITDQERDLLFSVTRAVILPYTRIYQSGVLLMAMSYPLAVVASDLPPNRDTLVDGKNGLLFSAGDASDLSRQLKRIIHDDQLARQCSSNALETMRLKHDPVTIGKTFANVLTAALFNPKDH